VVSIRTTRLKCVWFGLCVCMAVLAIVLVQHYSFLKQELYELHLLRTMYQGHVKVLKKLIEDTIDHHEIAGDRSEHFKKTLLTYLKQKEMFLEDDLEEVYRSLHIDNKAQCETKSIKGVTNDPLVATNKKAARRIFSWPIDKDKFWISSFFGKRTFGNGSWNFHYGLDMAAMKGTPIKAAAHAKVVEAGVSSGYGKTVLLQHNRFFKTRYAHLDRIRVRSGQQVQRGHVIGTVGATGNVRANGTDASHLHFEVHYNNRHVNPLYYLS
jgi:murein DD-endopeptidase MepM/ murein hydrolase activator NlpD